MQVVRDVANLNHARHANKIVACATHVKPRAIPTRDLTHPLSRSSSACREPARSCVSELRIDHGPGYRVYYTRRGSLLIVLLCGGDKSTQSKDIAEAMELAANWTDEEDEA